METTLNEFTPYPLDDEETLSKYAETLNQDKRESQIATYGLSDNDITDLDVDDPCQ